MIRVQTMLIAILLWPTVSITSASVGLAASFTATSAAVPVVAPVGSGPRGVGRVRRGGGAGAAPAPARPGRAPRRRASAARHAEGQHGPQREAHHETSSPDPGHGHTSSTVRLGRRRAVDGRRTASPESRAGHSASSPRSPVRMRTTFSSDVTKIFPSPNLPVFAVGEDGLDRLLDDLVGDDDLDLHLRQEVDLVLAAAVGLGVALLAAEALHLADRHAHDPHVLQRGLHGVEQVGPHDGFHLLHRSSLTVWAGARSPSAARSACSTRGRSLGTELAAARVGHVEDVQRQRLRGGDLRERDVEPQPRERVGDRPREARGGPGPSPR